MDSTVCPYCSKKYYNSSTKNRHIRNVHRQAPIRSDTKKWLVCCPLCSDGKKEIIESYILLRKHLLDVHKIVIKQEKFKFANFEDFEKWRELPQRNVNYIKQCVAKSINSRLIYYNCHRSNSRGTQSNCSKRMVKCQGSIKINGVCPSRIIARHHDNGEVEVDFFETHVGHGTDLRCQRLTTAEQKELAEKLQTGVPTDRIIKDARKLKENRLRRINLLNMYDLGYVQKNLNLKKESIRLLKLTKQNGRCGR